MTHVESSKPRNAYIRTNTHTPAHTYTYTAPLINTTRIDTDQVPNLDANRNLLEQIFPARSEIGNAHDITKTIPEFSFLDDVTGSGTVMGTGDVGELGVSGETVGSKKPSIDMTHFDVLSSLVGTAESERAERKERRAARASANGQRHLEPSHRLEPKQQAELTRQGRRDRWSSEQGFAWHRC